MPAPRQMHLGVFVLGTGNHIAGWRWPGAAQSFEDLSVAQEIARTAERGKFDLIFLGDNLSTEPGMHPELRRAVRAADHAGGAGRDDDGMSASAPHRAPPTTNPIRLPGSSPRSTISAAVAPPGTR